MSRFNALLKLRRRPAITLPDSHNLPSERYFLSLVRYFDVENALLIFMNPSPSRVLQNDNDKVLQRYVDGKLIQN